MCGQFNNPLKQYHNNTNTGQYLVDSHVELFAFRHSLKVLNQASLYDTIHAKPIPNYVGSNKTFVRRECCHSMSAQSKAIIVFTRAPLT